MNKPFRKVEEWKLEGKGFLVTVKHHTVEVASYMGQEDGGNRWAVYAYIYPKHSYFGKFKGRDMHQEAASAMPLHCGPSFLRWHYNDDPEHGPASVQVGCDYNHLYDDAFSFYSTEESADEVFSDARRLFAWLENIGATP